MPQGNQAILQILPQTDKDTLATGWATATLLPFVSESLQGQVTRYGSSALSRKSQRDVALQRAGTINVSGGVEFEATNHVLHAVLPLAFATTAVDNAAGNSYKRTYTPYVGDAKYASIKVNDSEVTRMHLGMVLAQLSMAAEVDKLATISTTWEGIDVDPQDETNPGGAVPAKLVGLYFEQGRVTIGGTQVSAASFNVQINRNAKTDRFVLGSRRKRDVPVSTYDITGSVMLDANSIGAEKSALFKAALSTGTLDLELDFVDPDNVVDGQPSRFTVRVPYATIDWPEHNISSEDFIEGNVNFTSYAVSAPAPVVAGTTAEDQFSIVHTYAL
ncbi:phage tail tube protein [Deinococcus kurensis]|uniref:phage tail tube protein n=1 Tax=Deinococcus kurensis TaxID=2662757 RepID=UPI0012D3120D|nr:phage tail tube protein [Deinococcus kurensis]